MPLLIGVDGSARTAKDLYIGVNGSAKRAVKAYVGVDGKARLIYSAEKKEPAVLEIGAHLTSGSFEAQVTISGTTYEQYDYPKYYDVNIGDRVSVYFYSPNPVIIYDNSGCTVERTGTQNFILTIRTANASFYIYDR